MKRAFICDTPFQLFNTLNFIINNHIEQNDLYLVNHFSGMEEIFNNIRDQDYFNNIYWVEYDRRREESNIKWNIKRIYYYLFPKKTIFRNMKNNDIKKVCRNYNEVYAGVVTCFVACILKANPKAEFIMIEDGTGSYSGNLLDFTIGWKHKLFARVFNCGSNVVKPNKLLVNNKKMCKSTISNNIQSLPLITEHTLEQIKKIFRTGEESKDNKINNIIWLTQPNDSYSKRSEINYKVAEILKKQKENITVRMHPRDKEVQIYKEFELDQSDRMWELFVATVDMDKKILISSHSSALFTPKIIFDKEPFLVFLYKLYDDEFMQKNWNNIETMIDNLRNEYMHKERIIIVKDFDCLEKVVLDAFKLIKGQTE